MKPIIEIHQLSKQYRLKEAAAYITLRETIAGTFKHFLSGRQNKSSLFWALRDIDLSIYPGQRVGIMGNNGAGKTTLLKILSRITPPSSGRAKIRGRLSSLLEVGTGFHPELSGRENIYFNGSILGLKKSDIDQQLDAIIEFSGVSQFIEMPLKNYSTGMQLRLAFAVAAHLEPEVLLIDEVLAVGDLEFQKKCLSKMEEVSQQYGRTILFVSHNMNYLLSLCDRGVLLDSGRIIEDGPVQEVVGNYVNRISNRTASQTWNVNEQPGNEIVKLLSEKIIDSSHGVKDVFKVNSPIGIEMTYEVLQDGHILWLGHNFHNQQGINVFDTHSVKSDYYKIPHKKGIYTARVWIPGNLLNTGTYFLSTAIFNHQEKVIHFHERDVLTFTVFEVFEEETARGLSDGEFPGVVRPLFDWVIEKH